MDSIHCVLEQLKVTNFRNISNQIISFGPRVNCIFGENGNGKTNLLEAIYVITQRKSFRKNTAFPQLVNINGEQPEILFQTKFNQGPDSKHTYSGKLVISKNQYFLNGRPTAKKCHLNSVFISPLESLLFYNTPGFRRQWFNFHLGLLSPSYRKLLSRYAQLLRMRNFLLAKKPPHHLSQIRALDTQLAQASYDLMGQRLVWVQEFNRFLGQIFCQLFSQSHQLGLKIRSGYAHCDAQEIHHSMRKREARDLAAGKTTYGIHHDDYLLLFDDLNSGEVCSLGQQKMAFFGLSFAYIELFKYKQGGYPIVLIDDVSGELDRKRWQNLIRYICAREFQTFMTTANESLGKELEGMVANVRKLCIHDGKIMTH